MGKINEKEELREQRGQRVEMCILNIPPMWIFKSPRFWTRAVLERVTECQETKNSPNTKGNDEGA